MSARPTNEPAGIGTFPRGIEGLKWACVVGTRVGKERDSEIVTRTVGSRARERSRSSGREIDYHLTHDLNMHSLPVSEIACKTCCPVLPASNRIPLSRPQNAP